MYSTWSCLLSVIRSFMEAIALNRTVLLDCAVQVVWFGGACVLGGGFSIPGTIRVPQRCRLSVRVDVGALSAIPVQVVYARDSVLFLCIPHVFRSVWWIGLRDRWIHLDKYCPWTDDGLSASVDEFPLLRAGCVMDGGVVDGRLSVVWLPQSLIDSLYSNSAFNVVLSGDLNSRVWCFSSTRFSVCIV